MQKHEADIEKLTIIPSDGGRFEVEVNGELIYSKLETHRHIEAGEGLRLIHDYLKQHA